MMMKETMTTTNTTATVATVIIIITINELIEIRLYTCSVVIWLGLNVSSTYRNTSDVFPTAPANECQGFKGQTQAANNLFMNDCEF